MKKTTLLLYSLICLFIACQIKKNYPTVSTFAGNGIMGLTNGKGNGASFANMMGVAIDRSGNVFVADSHNNLIRKITPDGLVTTFAGNGTAGEADGRPDQASFFSPE